MAQQHLAKDVFCWLLKECRSRPVSGSISDFLELYSEKQSTIEPDIIDSQSYLAKELGLLIDSYVNECNEIGKTPYLYRELMFPELVLSGLRILRSDSTRDKARKALLAEHDLVIETLHRLSPSDFESFVCGALQRAGIAARQTALTRDGGVDFLAEANVNISSLLHASRHSRVAFELVGQVKRYRPNWHLGPEKIRELIGATVLRIQRRSGNREYDIRKIPRISMFVTTAGLSRAAWNDARVTGCVVLDGELLNEFLIDVFLTIEEHTEPSTCSYKMLAWYGV